MKVAILIITEFRQPSRVRVFADKKAALKAVHEEFSFGSAETNFKTVEEANDFLNGQAEIKIECKEIEGELK